MPDRTPVERAAGSAVDPADGIWIGYAFSFTNPVLKIDCLGSPHEILEWFRERGLDPVPIAMHRDTEIQCASAYQDSPRLELLGGEHAPTLTKLLPALRQPGLDEAAAILKDDPAALTGDHNGASLPLLAAVAAGRLDAVRFLLDREADVDRAGEFDMTPLHWAGALGETEIVRELLESRADPGRRSWFRVTPGELARMNGRKDAQWEIDNRGDISKVLSAGDILERMGLPAVR